MLTFSIDGFHGTYERLRVGASRDGVWQTCAAGRGERGRKGGLRIEINYLVAQHGSRRDALRAARRSCTGSSSNPITDHGGQFQLPAELVPAAGDPRLISRLPLLPGFERNPCVHLWKEMFISAEGRVMLCCNDFKHASALPSVMERPLADIWRDAIGAVRAEHVNGRFDREPCRSCRLNVVPFQAPARTRRSILRRARRQRLLRAIVPDALVPPGARRRRFERESPFGYVDVPGAHAVVGGAILVQGWALAAAGRTIARIEVHVDGQPLGSAERGCFRPDVGEAYPGEGHSFGGFSHVLDTCRLMNGPHTLDIRIVDDASRRVDLGARTFVVAN